MAKRERIRKTNAMRELDRAGIAYEAIAYEDDEDVPSGELGLEIARQLGEDPASAFKTLVCVAPSGDHVVCCVPVACEIDLKRAAAAADEKSLAMLPLRDLEDVTGYVRGGCSPVGMRKRFPTIIDETAILFERIGISGGRRGLQILIDPAELARACDATFADIARETT
jgi:Cys-tRNA(Pro)/Cys-tRNA(Cys) deacylase